MASKRFQISDLGEYYNDCLTIEAAIKGRTRALEAASLLCSTLQTRQDKREKMVQYLADKHGKTYQEMWNMLLNGTFKPSESEIEENE